MRAMLILAAALCSASPAVAKDVDHGGMLFNRIQAEVDYADRQGGQLTWEIDGWIGGDFERVWLRSEGEITDGRFDEAEAQLYYGWNIDPFWDALIGARQDVEPESRTYLAAGLVGLAPYFFETEASLFVSDRGEVSARFEQSFDLLLTQRLIAEPHVEFNVFAQDVPERAIGAGLSDVKAALQLRYEITRKFAPYVEVEWTRKLGETASLARAAGEDAEDTALRLGLRVWF